MRCKVRVVGSISLALIATGVVGHLWNAKEKEFEKKVAMAPVLVTKRYIGQGKIVKKDDVEEKQIPVAYHEPGALTALPNMSVRTRIGLRSAEQLTGSKVVDSSLTIGLSWKLPDELVAITLSVTPEQAVGAALVPGDHVAIVGMDDQINKRLSCVQVLDINAPPTPADAESIIFNPDRTMLLTLALTLEQAFLVAKSRQNGPIQLALLPIKKNHPPRRSSGQQALLFGALEQQE